MGLKAREVFVNFRDRKEYDSLDNSDIDSLKKEGRAHEGIQKQCCMYGPDRQVKYTRVTRPARSVGGDQWQYELTGTCRDFNMISDPMNSNCAKWLPDICKQVYAKTLNATANVKDMCNIYLSNYCATRLENEPICPDFCTSTTDVCGDNNKIAYCRSAGGVKDPRCACLNTKPKNANEEVLRAMNGSNLSCWVPICRDPSDGSQLNKNQLTLSTFKGGAACKAEFHCNVNMNNVEMSDNAKIYVANECGGGRTSTTISNPPERPSTTPSNPMNNHPAQPSTTTTPPPPAKNAATGNTLQNGQDSNIILYIFVISLCGVLLILLTLLQRKRVMRARTLIDT